MAGEPPREMADAQLLVELRHPRARLPSAHRAFDAGYDLACVESFWLWPKRRRLVQTGLGMHLPDGVCGLVVPRSGLAAQFGVTIVNAPGLVDPGYQGAIGVILLNTGWRPFKAQSGDRIAQLLLVPFHRPPPLSVPRLPPARDAREHKGFGSSGR